MLRMLLTLIWVGFSGVRLVEGGGGGRGKYIPPSQKNKNAR